MSEKNFDLSILTPRKAFFTGKVSSLVAPGALGYLGVLTNHAPLMTTLSPGKITLRDPQGSTRTFQSKGTGFLEVFKNEVTLLAQEIE